MKPVLNNDKNLTEHVLENLVPLYLHNSMHSSGSHMYLNLNVSSPCNLPIPHTPCTHQLLHTVQGIPHVAVASRCSVLCSCMHATRANKGSQQGVTAQAQCLMLRAHTWLVVCALQLCAPTQRRVVRHMSEEKP